MPAFPQIRSSSHAAAAQNSRTLHRGDVHHAWESRRLNQAQVLHLLDDTVQQIEEFHASTIQSRVRRMQLEAIALATVLVSIVVTCASLVLA
jgi:hypothetical protein